MCCPPSVSSPGPCVQVPEIVTIDSHREHSLLHWERPLVHSLAFGQSRGLGRLVESIYLMTWNQAIWAKFLVQLWSTCVILESSSASPGLNVIKNIHFTEFSQREITINSSNFMTSTFIFIIQYELQVYNF